MKGTRGIVRTAAAAIGLSLTAHGQVSTGSHLYTQPDPSAGGGIQGRVAAPARPLVAAYALPPDEPRFVYRGAVGATGTFSFQGLPPSRYDLILVFEDSFYEGLVLSRQGSPMPSGDREAIEDIIGKSEPYYTKKFVHRIEGRGGTGGVARCICTFLRDRESVGFVDGKVYPDHRRSLKLVLLEQVGPGWQVVRTREIHTTMVRPGTGPLTHHSAPGIGSIRVTDSVRDMGILDLTGSGGK